MVPARKTDEQWLADKIAIDEHGCWNWTGGLQKDGYGICKRFGQSLAHRAVYFMMTGTISNELEIDHLCRNRKCVNPLHMQQVTHQQNISRSIYFRERHRNGRKTHCIRGHEFNDQNSFIENYKGKIMRKCRVCINMRQRERWNAKKLNDARQT